MKRQICPSTLAAIGWWAANPNCHIANCMSIELPTGQTLYATDGQWDITIPAVLSPTGADITFRAGAYGVWTRGKITSEAGTKCNSNTMTLSCVPRLGATYPGLRVGILNAAFNRLFDGATVWVYAAYMPMGEYGTVTICETLFQGTITTRPVLDRNLVQFDCADPFFLLNLKVPSRVFQSNCPWSFCDSNCGLNAADYTVDFTAGVSTLYVLTPASALSQAAGYFTQGLVTCLSGGNAGLSQTVKAHDGSGNLNMAVPWLFGVNPGDTFRVIKGCDKTVGTCALTKRANGTSEPNDYKTRFGGTPFTPAPSSAV